MPEGSADLFPASHLRDTCASVRVEAAHVLLCERRDHLDRWIFDETTGLLQRRESTLTSSGRTTTTHFEKYRRASGIMTPFRERIVTPTTTVMYVAESVRYNEPVPAGAVVRPDR